jgi:hypothetical protein
MLRPTFLLEGVHCARVLAEGSLAQSRQEKKRIGRVQGMEGEDERGKENKKRENERS